MSILDSTELTSIADAYQWADHLSGGIETIDIEAFGEWIWENVPHQTPFEDDEVQDILQTVSFPDGDFERKKNG